MQQLCDPGDCLNLVLTQDTEPHVPSTKQSMHVDGPAEPWSCVGVTGVDLLLL